MGSPWKNVLFATHTKPAYMPPPHYGDRMVVCGPHYPTRHAADGSIISIQTPGRHPYDIASLIAALPNQQKPDIVIVRVDAGMENIPGNLAAVQVPKIAILGDSHHMRAPLQNLVSYTLAERYDWLILDHNKQHAHWYLEAGLRNVVWIPALLLVDDFRPPVADSRKEITFIGQLGSIHPHRSRLINHIRSGDLPLSVDSVPQELAAGRYNQSRITLNCSLNGDLNLRVFETMASGGMLMTDRLSPLSGLYSLFSEGEEFVDFGNYAEFDEKAKYYLQNTRERNRVARKGYQSVKRMMSIQSRTRAIADLVNDGHVDPLFTIDSDQRIKSYGCHSKSDLYHRIRLYEWVQEQHRRHDNIHITNTASGDIRILCDLADLPHLSLFSTGSTKNREMIRNSGLDSEISIVPEGLSEPADGAKSIAIVSAMKLRQILLNYRPDAVLIADTPALDKNGRAAVTESLSGEGYAFGERFGGLGYRTSRWKN